MAQQPVQVTMQPLRSEGPPVPLRWAEALRNVEAAQRSLGDLSKQLDGALYLDEESWRQAVPQAHFTAALQGQQRKIAELEAQLASVVARLEESERGRRAAEARASELGAELENHNSVFKLHYEELLRKDGEINDLQAVIQALSLGGNSGSAGSGGGGGGRRREGGASGRTGGGGDAAGGGGLGAAAGGLDALLGGGGLSPDSGTPGSVGSVGSMDDFGS